MSRLRSQTLAGIVCALCLAATPLAAQDQPGSIRGTVLDPRNTALPGTEATARDSVGDETPAVSGPDGTFLIGGLDPGLYTLTVRRQGFSDFRVMVTVTAGMTTQVSVQLTFAALTPPVDAPQPGASVPAAADSGALSDFVPIPDRWRLRFPVWQRYPEQTDLPFVNNRGFDPYDQNVLKGDLPVFGDSVFLNLTFVSETPFEYRSVPTPSGASAERPDSEAFFGDGNGLLVLPLAIASVELFRGSTAFRPRDWAFRVTPAFNYNYVSIRERGALLPSPAEPTKRRRHFLALQEAFGEAKLADVGANYDFVSVRAGIQPFNSDFRGFLFRDTNLGVRGFGTFGRNRTQWNAAFFDQLEKETNSDLNLRERRHQRVYVANIYRQDFLTSGYTISPSFHASFDEDEEFFFDRNGFLVRPAPVGLIAPHAVRVYYAGVGGDGHWGRLNVTHQFYQAIGTDEFNGIAGGEVEINAQFAAVELSVSHDWYRPRVTFVYASGDGEPGDDRATGFDAIIDNPNIAGGQFSYWVRQGLRLPGTGLALVGRSSLLPSLRSSKAEGQASFVNPGLLLVGGGYDAELTTKLRMSVNVNYLRFHRTEVLQRILFQRDIDAAIGLDSSVGFQYRPALNDNLVLTAGASMLTPGKGFRQILTAGTLYSPFVSLTLTY